MRILQVINSLEIGGAEQFTACLAAKLAARGHECSVLSLYAGAPAYADGLEKAGVRVLYPSSGKASLYSPGRIGDILAAVRGIRPDIVHAHLWPGIYWSALADLLAPGPALVMTEHTTSNRRMRLLAARPLERLLHCRYARILCVSEEVAGALEAWLGIDRHRLVVQSNGIDLDRFSGPARPDPGLSARARGRRLVVMTARMVPEKDHSTALKALSLLPDDYTLAFLGDGPSRASVEQEARVLGLSDRVHFLGEQTDVPGILACGHAYIQTSRQEGFGIACLEAMAAGLPVAASDTGGLGPLVRGAGELFAPGDAAACAAAVRRFCEDPAARDRAIRAGRDRASRYSLDAAADAHLALYSALRGTP